MKCVSDGHVFWVEEPVAENSTRDRTVTISCSDVQIDEELLRRMAGMPPDYQKLYEECDKAIHKQEKKLKKIELENKIKHTNSVKKGIGDGFLCCLAFCIAGGLGWAVIWFIGLMFEISAWLGTPLLIMTLIGVVQFILECRIDFLAKELRDLEEEQEK